MWTQADNLPLDSKQPCHRCIFSTINRKTAAELGCQKWYVQPATLVRQTGWPNPSQVVLAASICTRGGKAVLSRQFREMPRSRIEGLLASFPKLADSGTQHTTVEQDNVRFVYQPLDELYMVLITNRHSNILQDIDSLHLFAQVVTSTCKSLDEREILKNSFELLSAFDELVTLGYRENLTISQIKTFMDMESHEERIQEIIARVGHVHRTRQVRSTHRPTEQRARGHRGKETQGQTTRNAAEGVSPKPWRHPADSRLSHIHTTFTAEPVRYI
jgi:coatomer subunit delta